MDKILIKNKRNSELVKKFTKASLILLQIFSFSFLLFRFISKLSLSSLPLFFSRYIL